MSKRRGNGEGSIGKVKGRDLFVARVHVDQPDGTRKRKALYGKTRAEVRDLLAEIMGDAAKGVVYDSGSTTVAEFVTSWLEDSAAGDLAPRTLANYRLQVRRHIIPALGRIKLSKLTASHVQTLYASKLRDGLRPSSVRYIHAVLHRALEQAVRWGMVPQNVASLVDTPKIRREEVTPLDASQARAFLDAAKGEKHEALYVLSLTTGLRIGEALGLKWSDIDLDAGTLRVNRQLQRMRRDAATGEAGELEFSEPKNASRRTVNLPQRALDALRSHRRAQAGQRLRTADYADHDLVFATEKGNPLEAQNIVNRHYKPLLRRADLPDIRWHDLRHTYATLLLARGTHPVYVQKSLGHASVQLTLDVYSHWMPSMGRDTASAIDAVLAPDEAVG